MDYPERLITVADGVHVWAPDGVGTWGLANCVLVTSRDEAALVDTPYTTDLTERLLAAAQPLLPPGGRIGTVVNTHANGDHAYGNCHFPDAEIISSEAGLEHARNEPGPEQLHQLVHHSDRGTPLGWYLYEHFGRYDFRGMEPTGPTRTFSGELTLTVGATELRLIEVGPAHTTGDVIVHLPEQGVVCTGDVYFEGDHVVHWAGPLSRVADAVRTVLDLDPAVVVPGHGPVGGPRELRAHLAYLEDITARIHALREQGRDAAEAAAELLRTDPYPRLGMPERLCILTELEYQHLDAAPTVAGPIQLVTAAARAAFDRAHPGHRDGDQG